jgi:hypothetical protein
MDNVNIAGVFEGGVTESGLFPHKADFETIVARTTLWFIADSVSLYSSS